jgi:YVTN family beta-propeller protein
MKGPPQPSESPPTFPSSRRHGDGRDRATFNLSRAVTRGSSFAYGVILIAVAGLTAATAPASSHSILPADAARPCPGGAVAAVIGGEHRCLIPGQRCAKRLDRQYHRYGFHCHTGRLTRAAKPPAPFPSAGVITAQIPIGRDGGPIASGFGSLWVRNQTDGTVSRVDPEANQVVATIPVGRGVGGIAAGEGAVWTANFDDSTVSRIDPDTNQVVATVSLGGTGSDAAPIGVATTPGAVWVGGHHAGRLFRIDTQTNAVVASVAVGPAASSGPGGVEISQGDVWVAVSNTGSVVRVDPATNAIVATVNTGPCIGPPGAADNSAVWMSSGVCGTGEITRIDPATNSVVATVREDLGGYPIGLASGLGSIWAVIGGQGMPGILARIDPQTNRVVGRVNLPQNTGLIPDVAVAAGAVWVTDYDRLLRIQPAP